MGLENLLVTTTGDFSIMSNFGIPLLLVVIAVIILKGLALYKAATLREKGWFWIMIIINSLGIIPAIYLWIKRKK